MSRLDVRSGPATSSNLFVVLKREGERLVAEYGPSLGVVLGGSSGAGSPALFERRAQVRVA